MNVVLATIIPIFLLMPGFAFIAGVNISDKTIREIVFRSTPAEVAYVVAASLLVHFFYSCIPWWPVNPGLILANGVQALDALSYASANAHTAAAIRLALWYFILSSFLGGGLGVLLGLAVAKWQPRIFIKHRWMTAFIGLRGRRTVYARVLTTPSYKLGKNGDEAAIYIQGYVRDCFFAAEGKLLYLVFTGFETRTVIPGYFPMETEPDRNMVQGGNLWPSAGPDVADRLVIEGDHVALVRYESVRVERVVRRSDEAVLEQAAEEDDPLGSDHLRGA